MADLVATITQVRGTPTSEGRAREHRILIDRPTSKGGLDRGPMGGELLLVALGGCFMSNLIAAAGARGLPVEGLEVTLRGTLAAAPPRFDAIELEVQAATLEGDALDKLITIAERGCIVHNTLTPAVKLTVRRA
ncbi:MAG TPA: OsmC family protein [Methylomirabilota bacterium]|nr:OsmC family protein [Methylomirabilota bacterium]